jgi:hypothetical protein
MSGEAADPAIVAMGVDDELMVLPAARVAEIEECAVTICLPGEAGGLRLKRGAYEVYRAFHLPRRVADVLPADSAKRERVLGVVRLLAAKGFLVPPKVGIPAMSGDPTPEAEPNWISVLA